TAIFSVVNGVLLEPLPYPDAHELVTVGVAPDRPGEEPGHMSYPDLADLEAENPALDVLVGYSTSSLTLTGLGEPRIVETARVSGGLLRPFRLAPVVGRDVRRDEFGADAARVVVLGHGFWKRNFAGSADVLGRTVELNGVAYEVVGVAPEGFDFPEGSELWTPRRLDVERCGRACHTWRAVGRLGSGATLEAARAASARIAANLTEAHPETNTGKTFAVEGLQDRIVGSVRRGLWLVLGAVGVVLLIACANVANLLLVRASSRTGEVAVRAALGASRGRLSVQVLVESAVLAAAGGVAGLAVAFGGVELLRRVSPGTIPRIDEVGIDGTVLLFTGGLVVVTTVLFGLSPALHLARTSITQNLVHGGRGGGTEGGERSRSGLLAVEVALSLLLLVGAGLLLRTFGQLYAVDPGFETREVVRFTLSLPSSRYDTLPEIRSFYRTLEDRLRALPGVEEAGSIYGAPLGRGNVIGDVLVDGRPELPPGQEDHAALRPVSPEYLETMRIPLIRGR
ncbi:MAG TPA: ABC transporter permease, partial [Longimicrobiales bacterium]|nr:ABC transporter permease [Longimicrobiales bacterium]